MVGVGVGTMALVVVLSFFNGLEELFRSLYGAFSSEIQVKPAEGKFFMVTDSLLAAVRAVPGVASVSEAIEDNALLIYRDAQVVGKIRGVNEELLRQNGLDSILVAGKLELQKNGVDYAILGGGLQYMLGVSLADEFQPIQVWYPNTSSKTINLTSPNAVQRKNIRPSAVFALEQQYDNNYMFVPLSFAQDLLKAGNKRTSLEIKTKPGVRLTAVQQSLRQLLGNTFIVQNRDEQNATMLRAIQIEKLFVYVTLSFILLIASCNIFFSLTMLAVDKKKDVAILYALGATSRFIRRLFIAEGAIIASVGAVVGLVLGFIICILQKQFGLISMGMQTSIIEAYPVQMRLNDFLLTAFTVSLIVFIVSFFPARQAARNADVKL